MAVWLAGYAVLFTLAYVRINAGPGALLLFGSVQLTMFAAALARGETLSPKHWSGVGLALTGFLVLTLPGLSAPDPLGAALMAGSGVCWGLYSLAGRRAADPLGVTGDNFLRAAAMVLVAGLGVGLGDIVTPTGVALASASGALASALAYAAWYSVLPLLAVWRAAVVQLSVPILTALGATIFLGESVTSRLAGAMALVIAGIWLTTSAQPRTAQHGKRG
jgi:drug/metabolite transporter (DMT)-like permease